MRSTPYTIVLTRGSVCTNELGRKAVLAALQLKARNASIPVVDLFSGEVHDQTVDLLDLVTILRHDSAGNAAVRQQLLGASSSVVSLSDYIARRSGLSSAS